MQQEKKYSLTAQCFLQSLANSNRVHLCNLKPGGLIFSELTRALSQSCLGTKHSGKPGKKVSLQPGFQNQPHLGCPNTNNQTGVPKVSSLARFSSKNSQERFLLKTPHLQTPSVSPDQNPSQLEPDQVKLLFLNCVWLSLLTMCSLAHFLPQRHCMSHLRACTGVAADILWEEAEGSEDALCPSCYQGDNLPRQSC